MELSTVRSENLFKQAKIVELNEKIGNLVATNCVRANKKRLNLQQLADESAILEQNLKLRFEVESMRNEKSIREREMYFLKAKHERERGYLEQKINIKELEIAELKKMIPSKDLLIKF